MNDTLLRQIEAAERRAGSSERELALARRLIRELIIDVTDSRIIDAWGEPLDVGPELLAVAERAIRAGIDERRKLS